MLDRIKDSFTPEDDRSVALLEEVCRWIDGVHGVQGRAEYIFAIEELEPGKHGEHTQAFEVIVSSSSSRRVHTGIHELGHVLDGVFLNTVQLRASPSDPPMEFASDMAEALEGKPGQGGSLLCGWLAAVRASQYHRNLVAAYGECSRTPNLAREIGKLLRTRELWARSYELFVCRRHPGTWLAAGMDVECGVSARVGGVTIHNYWQGSDFDKVEAEIEAVFRRLGWLIE